MEIIVTVLHVVACLFLIVVVLLQTGKGADIGAVFGGSSQTIFGSSGAGNLLTKLTTWTAVLFMVTSLYLTWSSTSHLSASVVDTIPIEPPPIAEPAAGAGTGVDADDTTSPAPGAPAAAGTGTAPADGGAAAPAAAPAPVAAAESAAPRGSGAGNGSAGAKPSAPNGAAGAASGAAAPAAGGGAAAPAAGAAPASGGGGQDGAAKP